MRARIASPGLNRYAGAAAICLRLRRDVAQRAHVVEHPEAAAVRPDHQIVHVIVGVEHHVADRRARQIQPQRLPVIAVVERNVDGRLGAGEEQALLFRILADDVHLAAGALVARQAVDDARPGLAGVVRAIDVVLLGGRARRTAAAAAADVREHVGRVDVAVAGFDGDEVGVRAADR